MSEVTQLLQPEIPETQVAEALEAKLMLGLFQDKMQWAGVLVARDNLETLPAHTSDALFALTVDSSAALAQSFSEVVKIVPSLLQQPEAVDAIQTGMSALNVPFDETADLKVDDAELFGRLFAESKSGANEELKTKSPQLARKLSQVLITGLTIAWADPDIHKSVLEIIDPAFESVAKAEEAWSEVKGINDRPISHTPRISKTRLQRLGRWVAGE